MRGRAARFFSGGRWRVGVGAVALWALTLAVSFPASGSEGADVGDELGLTAGERAFLAAHPVVRLGHAPDFPPIDFVDEQGEFRGFSAEVAALVAQRLGIRFERVPTDTWRQTLEKASAREVDVLAAASPTEERRSFLLFTQPLLRLPLVIVARTGSRRALSLEQLAGRRVALEGHRATAEDVRRLHPEIELVLVDKVTEGLAEVAFGNAEAFIAPLATSSHYIQRAGITNLRLAGEAGLSHEPGIAVRSDWPELASAIDKALRSISAGERQRMLSHWAELDASEAEPRAWWMKREVRSELLRIFAVVLITLVALLVAVQIWRSTLVRMVGRQTRALQQQRALLEDIVASIPSAIFWKDAQSVYEGCNAEFARLLGLPSPAQVVGRSDLELQVSGESAAEYRRIDQLVLGSGSRYLAEEQRDWPGRPRGTYLISKAPRLGAGGRAVGIVGVMTDIADLKRAEEAVRDNELRYRSLFEAASEAILVLRDGAIVDSNPMAAQLFGLSQRELIGRRFAQLSPDEQPDCRPSRDSAAERLSFAELGAAQQFEWRFLRAEGEPFDTEVRLGRFEVGGERRLIALVRDVSDRKRAEAERARLEAQLRQAQKMEAVGQLAGGVAHDFNNILTALMSGLELARVGLQKRGVGDRQLAEMLDESLQHSERAAALTRQLLAFSRKQVTQPRVLDLNGTVSGLEKMLRRLIAENIALELKLSPEPRRVLADPGQLEQVIVNLAVNARDAMPDGGSLRIETGSATLGEAEAAAFPGARPGPQVVLSVTDTGCGMDAATLERVFEPFFTTKPAGKGTGLGLATVYGIVQQSNGYVKVESEPGRGTRFSIFLPEACSEAGTAEADAAASAPGGSETVLVCEDDEAVRERIVVTLREAGYQVLAAADGSEAIDLADDHHGQLHLLLTDVVMPEMDGNTLSRELRLDIPGLRTLFVTGYAADRIAHHGVSAPSANLLEKPFNRSELLRRVREVLDSPQRGGWC